MLFTSEVIQELLLLLGQRAYVDLYPSIYYRWFPFLTPDKCSYITLHVKISLKLGGKHGNCGCDDALCHCDSNERATLAALISHDVVDFERLHTVKTDVV